LCARNRGTLSRAAGSKRFRKRREKMWGGKRGTKKRRGMLRSKEVG